MTSPELPLDVRGRPVVGRLYTAPITAGFGVRVAHEVTDEAFAAGRGEYEASCRAVAAAGAPGEAAPGQYWKGHHPVNTAPNTGRRWALSPVDSRSHLLAEAGGAPDGMVVADCGQVLPGSVDTSPHPPAGPRCPVCVRAAGRVWAPLPEASSADLVAVMSPELVASLVLRRACDGGVAKVGNHYVDRGSSTPRYQAGTFDELINAGFLALAEQDLYGLRRVRVTEAGHVRYAQLVDTRTRAGQWVPQPRYPTTEPSPSGICWSSTPPPAASGAPDPVRGSGPAMHWVRCPTDGRLHAIQPTDNEQATARGYAEALCGHRLPAEGLVVQDVPSGALCLPCVIGATADMPDPGRMGTTQ